MDISVYVASAFSKNNKGGNKAGVVLNEPTLATAQKMAIAKQLGYAETAFLTESNCADFKLEYFTPKEEVALCGHATIGTFAILMHLNKIHKNQYTIETNSGVLTITIKEDTIFMEQNQPTFYDIIPPNNLTGCFDLNSLNANYPIQIVSTGLKDILIPVKSEADLYALEPNFEMVKEVSKQYEVVGMHLYTFNDDRIICRNFAPLFDINEEAATGTSNGALACYLYQHQYLQKELYVFEQGHSLHSPSEILVKLDVTGNNEIARVYVGGNGYYSETKYLSIE
ncbi:PhzF family phenazine biosynthesis protein [Listeria monocytogenes]|uniref:PhzF family phenazine biosynthesis protein n=1 Tax=Listeria monocytogenes TaxID=1639 RepID=UPI0008759E12|nr:PhzF family phenazine biosynthesis protein [Listeria monocytogenes]EAK8929535.1 PhzF family phenazine biosynthesis protein [Listeria monocytogenes]ECP9711679.1 PhzF family phenazine biosynthesis protein [Listeria monocytogenes]EFQ8450242.1 PhzF family phenazine biosynthesis protein [Listeria monocytogenes]EJS8318497.1 PhzF family phenazine biosynthesis protein [Listeria monocytogenes]EKZ0825110.1 PhzF family phenazine biosynthesis protein [Listeria monocytogenes]